MKNIQKCFKVSVILMVAFTSCFVSAQLWAPQFWSGHFWFDIVRLKQILQNNSAIKYIKCADKLPYKVAPFEIEPSVPNKIIFDELFTLLIPQGKIQGIPGFVVIDNQYVYEFVWAEQPIHLYAILKIPDDQVRKVLGRVAVIPHTNYGNYTNHYHLIYEILGGLAVLEMNGIEYDWLYIPYDISRVQTILTLWGIDSSKIISPVDAHFSIQADEVIVPSCLCNINIGFEHYSGQFIHPITMNYVKNKLLKKVEAVSTHKVFSRKIFISRKDSMLRRILNEDDVFQLFEPLGFVRYELSKMTVEEQILLFKNAEIMVGEHGAGLTNLLFCNKETMVIELFQRHINMCFWWISSACELQYFPVKLLNMDTEYSGGSYDSKTNVSLDNIYPVIEMLKK